MFQHKMQGQRRSNWFKSTSCRALCCTNCRVSVSSSTADSESLGSSDRYPTVSSLAHYMVQEKLDQMIKDSEEDRARRLIEARKGKQKRVVKNATTSGGGGSSSSSRHSGRRLAVVVAMEKCTWDPREEFRQSMAEVILANKIEKPKDLRYLLNCYLSMNSEYRGVILEAFHQVVILITFLNQYGSGAFSMHGIRKTEMGNKTSYTYQDLHSSSNLLCYRLIDHEQEQL